MYVGDEYMKYAGSKIECESVRRFVNHLTSQQRVLACTYTFRKVTTLKLIAKGLCMFVLASVIANLELLQ